MDFAEMQALVKETTKRPDKTAEVKSAINRAIELYTKAANWSEDLVDLSVNIDASLYAQSIDIAVSLPLFRKVKYLRPTGQTKYLTFVEPDKLFTPEGQERVNTWYRGGNLIYFKLTTLSSQMLVGYYKYYNFLVNNTDTHWMLTKASTLIHDRACADIWDQLGADTEARRYERYAREHFLVAERDLADGAARV